MGSRETRATAHPGAIKLFWWGRAHVPNFGDAMSPLLVAALSGREVAYADTGRETFRAVGSILDEFVGYGRHKRERLALRLGAWRKPRVTVWGSGFIFPQWVGRKDLLTRRLRVAALRGARSREIMRRLLGEKACDWARLPLGDPGLLFGRLLAEPVTPRYEVGFMWHFTDAPIAAYVGETLRKRYGKVCLIAPAARAPLDTLRLIAQCRTLVSSAMHGCIAADGLGIPNLPVHLSLTGMMTQEACDFKWQDYYSALSYPPSTVCRDRHAPGVRRPPGGHRASLRPSPRSGACRAGGPPARLPLPPSKRRQPRWDCAGPSMS